MLEGVSQALPWVFARERKHSPVCAFNHFGGCYLSNIEGPALEKDQSNRESAGTWHISEAKQAAKGARGLELVWRAAAGGTALEGSDVRRSTEEASDISTKSKSDLFPNWDTILRQKGIFSLSPNAMSQCKRTKAER